MSDESYLPKVREQYEQFPYPPRDLANEQNNLIHSWMEYLALINHFCFAGRESFGNGFRCLVAGGGTGDSSIFLAEQLKEKNASVVHLDLSAASIEVAKARANVRGLTNISFVHGSIHDIPTMDLGEFDYINCSSVLHHLEDPDAGYDALLSVLKENGAMGIMLYGRYGRTAIYQMQELLRLLNKEQPDPRKQIEITKQVLSTLPVTNWYQHSKSWITDIEQFGDNGIFDLFLHSQDRSYTVPELYEWFVDKKGMHLQLTAPHRGHSVYDAQLYLNPNIQHTVAEKSLREREAVAELVSGALITHCMYLTKGVQTAKPDDKDNVPFFSFCMKPMNLVAMADQFEQNPGMAFDIELNRDIDRPKMKLHYQPGPMTHEIIRQIDGEQTIGQIIDAVQKNKKNRKAGFDATDVKSEFIELYDFFHRVGGIHLRHKSIKAFEYLI